MSFAENESIETVKQERDYWFNAAGANANSMVKQSSEIVALRTRVIELVEEGRRLREQLAKDDTSMFETAKILANLQSKYDEALIALCS